MAAILNRSRESYAFLCLLLETANMRVDGAQMLRPDDPETKIAVASKWDHVDTYRFSAPLPPMDSHLWNIKADPPRLIEIKVTASSNNHDFQKTVLFRIRVDQQKKLLMERE